MKVGSGARWEEQEGFHVGSAGVTLEPSLCRRLAGTALQSSQNADHIHVSCSGSASAVSPSPVAPQLPSVGGRKARKRVRAQGNDPETMATVQKPEPCLCLCCLSAQQHHTAGAHPAHVPNASLSLSILPGLK